MIKKILSSESSLVAACCCCFFLRQRFLYVADFAGARIDFARPHS